MGGFFSQTQNEGSQSATSDNSFLSRIQRSLRIKSHVNVENADIEHLNLEKPVLKRTPLPADMRVGTQEPMNRTDDNAKSPLQTEQGAVSSVTVSSSDFESDSLKINSPKDTLTNLSEPKPGKSPDVKINSPVLTSVPKVMDSEEKLQMSLIESEKKNTSNFIATRHAIDPDTHNIDIPEITASNEANFVHAEKTLFAMNDPSETMVKKNVISQPHSEIKAEVNAKSAENSSTSSEKILSTNNEELEIPPSTPQLSLLASLIDEDDDTPEIKLTGNEFKVSQKSGSLSQTSNKSSLKDTTKNINPGTENKLDAKNLSSALMSSFQAKKDLAASKVSYENQSKLSSSKQSDVPKSELALSSESSEASIISEKNIITSLQNTKIVESSQQIEAAKNLMDELIGNVDDSHIKKTQYEIGKTMINSTANKEYVSDDIQHSEVPNVYKSIVNAMPKSQISDSSKMVSENKISSSVDPENQSTFSDKENDDNNFINKSKEIKSSSVDINDSKSNFNQPVDNIKSDLANI